MAFPLMNCLKCGCETEKRGPLQRYCAPCNRVVKNERNKELERLKRRAAGAATIGESMRCQKCSGECVRTNGQQRYCEPCSAVVKLELHRVANAKYEKGKPPRVRNSEADREYRRQWAANNRDRVAQSQRASRERRREAINAYSRDFRKTEYRKEWYRNWEREKRRTDPKFRLEKRMAVAVRRALRNGKAGRSWEAIVGYSADDLVRHIERQFLRGMSWANMGEWHVDHVQPLVSFAYETEDDPEFRAAWSLSNLRPLWAEENWKKNGKRIFLI